MRKSVLAAIVLFFALASIILASNTFTKMEKISIQHWSQDISGYEEAIYINDKSTLKKIRKILNDSIHENHQSEMAQSANLKLTLFYEDNKQEKIYLWEESGQYTIFTSQDREGTFSLKDNDSKGELKDLIK
ncbi:hypothetical protein E2R51_16555 [Jeotgalibacillus sp. S-D1]|uniref:hypothetical protein n=1 Tax=Jeotgalibacillus sp. S-D1 TaxID=2552189 RepID=UPI0010598F81|nr:hypothetical protein [Jeotgalibacillus sp. S-D1]TDL30933.1 hypothetical protein E2R51_16555 [Jeotgalibacillus sp. S-D1]